MKVLLEATFSLLLLATTTTYVSAFEDLCFQEVQRLAPFDANLRRRQLNKLAAVQNILKNDFAAVQDPAVGAEFFGYITNTTADGTMSACGPTVSWLAELYLTLMGELTLNLPETWDLTTDGDALTEMFEVAAGEGNHVFWYMATSGSHTSHVWAIEQLPAEPEKNLEVRYRVMMSAWDAYTLGGWLTPDLSAEEMVDQRMAFQPLDAEVEPAASYWSLQQMNFNTPPNGFCAMDPQPGWPPLATEWVEHMLEFEDVDAANDLLKAKNRFGGGQVITKEEFFGPDGFLTLLASWLNAATTAANAVPVGTWTEEMNEQFINLFGFATVDHYPGVPYIAGLGKARRDLIEFGSPEALASSSRPQERLETPGLLGHGLLINQAIIVDETACKANADGILSVVPTDDRRVPENAVAPSLAPEEKATVCDCAVVVCSEGEAASAAPRPAMIFSIAAISLVSALSCMSVLF